MIPALSELHLVQWRFPWGALVLLLPLALGWLARHRRQRLASYADAHLLPWAVASGMPPAASMGRRVAELLAWALFALAAAGPRIAANTPDGADAGIDTPHVVDVMVVLDVSASMAATDIAPDRLSRARLKLADLLPRLRGERLGLLLYAGQAGLLLPPTHDAVLFERALSQAGPDLLDAPGSNVAQALRLARQALTPDAASGAQVRPRARAVLLVTDAETSSLDGAAGEAAQQAVEELRGADISLFVLAVASADGAPVPLAGGGQAKQDGVPVVSRPAARAYERLAQRAGGRYAAVTDGNADWNALYDGGIARLPGADVAGAQLRAWRELFALPLGLALALLLWAHLPPATRRSSAGAGVLTIAGLIGAVATSPADAAAAQPVSQSSIVAAAALAYRSGQWRQALALFERQGAYAGHMGAGAVAWKLRDYALATQHFSNALLLARTDTERDDALYNLGNAHFGQSRWYSAAQAWRAVLLSRPGDARAAANLVHAEAQLAKRRVEPMQSDLRGRRGFIAEGLVSVDGAVPRELDESWRLLDTPQGPRAGAGPDATGARQVAGADTAGTPSVALNPQRLQSGLVKLDRLEDRKRQLLQGLLKQDRVPAASSAAEAAPW